MRHKYYASIDAKQSINRYQTGNAVVERHDPLEIQLEHFCNVIRGTASPLVSVRDGLRNLIITEAISAAAKSGSIMEIGPI